MNANDIRNIAVELSPGKTVSVELEDRECDHFQVVSCKKGRGRGGSWIIEARKDEERVIFGTSNAKQVRRVTLHE